jgi:hypothetical protein
MTKTPPGDAEHSPPSPLESEVIARRKLLKLGVYVAPTIIGTLLISGNAHAQATCGPSDCHPVTCDPKGCPPVRCVPDGGAL